MENSNNIRHFTGPQSSLLLSYVPIYITQETPVPSPLYNQCMKVSIVNIYFIFSIALITLSYLDLKHQQSEALPVKPAFPEK